MDLDKLEKLYLVIFVEKLKIIHFIKSSFSDSF